MDYFGGMNFLRLSRSVYTGSYQRAAPPAPFLGASPEVACGHHIYTYTGCSSISMIQKMPLVELNRDLVFNPNLLLSLREKVCFTRVSRKSQHYSIAIISLQLSHFNLMPLHVVYSLLTYAILSEPEINPSIRSPRSRTSDF